MASSYTAPTATYIKLRSGVNAYIEGLSSGALDTKLEALIPAAEARAALHATEDVFASTDLTAVQAQALTDAVALRVAAMYLRSPMVEKVTGSHEPLLMEESDRLRQVALDLEGEAEELEQGVRSAIEEAAGEPETDLPNFTTGTFAVTTYDPEAVIPPEEEWVVF